MSEKETETITNTYNENYPLSTVIISNLVTLAIYGTGAYIMFRVGVISMTVYIVFILLLEFLLFRNSCRDCYYYGKRCAFCRGLFAPYLVKRGNPERFVKKQVSWKSIIPDILATLIPIVTAVVLMIVDFHWILPVMVFILILLAGAGNGFVRGVLACRYCKQRELGCPAEKLFDRQRSGQGA